MAIDAYDMLEDVQVSLNRLDMGIRICRARIKYMKENGEWDEDSPKCSNITFYLLGMKRARELFKDDQRAA